MTPLLAQYRCLAVALNRRDAYTEGHCGRVVDLASCLATVCAVASAELQLLKIAATFHDIGKVGVSDAVLHKPGRFNEEEWKQMKAHSVFGQEIFDAIPHVDSGEIGRVIRHHHESYDGSGYPDGLSGESIPVLSRILAIADNYDAMATARPYHPSRRHDEVMELMQKARGSKFDPYLYDRFTPLLCPRRPRQHQAHGAPRSYGVPATM